VKALRDSDSKKIDVVSCCAWKMARQSTIAVFFDIVDRLQGIKVTDVLVSLSILFFITRD